MANIWLFIAMAELGDSNGVSGRASFLTNSISKRFCSVPESVSALSVKEAWLKQIVTGNSKQGLNIVMEPPTCIPETAGGWSLFWAKWDRLKQSNLGDNNVHGNVS